MTTAQRKNRITAWPLLNQKALVQCEGFRGFAYRNRAGVWKNASTYKILPRVIEFSCCPENKTNPVKIRFSLDPTG
jgi:hypothetical protein